MNQQALARKYRPRKFAEVIDQQPIVQALSNAIKLNRLHQALLFSGPRGLGKTTLARIVAAALNCTKRGTDFEPCGRCDACEGVHNGTYMDFIEVDGASKTKVDDIRELLENIPFVPSSGEYKIYLIDEVHMLSTHSFNALLKSLEEPPAHLVFLLATTEAEKIPATVLSRCIQLRLTLLPQSSISQHLAHLLDQEKFEFEREAVECIAQCAQGSMRDALSLLDQAIAHGAGSVCYDNVMQMLGRTHADQLRSLMEGLRQQNAQTVFAVMDDMVQRGHNLETLLDQLLDVFQQAALHQQYPKDLAPSAEALAASHIDAELLQFYYQATLLSKRDFAYVPQPQMAIEMLFLRMLAFSNRFDSSAASASAPESASLKTATASKPSKSRAEANAAQLPPAHSQANSKANSRTSPKGNTTESASTTRQRNFDGMIQASHKADASKSPAAVPESAAAKVPKVTHPPVEQATHSPSAELDLDPQWLDFVQTASLHGVSAQLADQCVPVQPLAQSEEFIKLQLSERLDNLNQELYVGELNEALCAYLKRTVEVHVVLTSAHFFTVADFKRNQVLHTLKQDPAFLKLESIGAHIDTVEPILDSTDAF